MIDRFPIPRRFRNLPQAKRRRFTLIFTLAFAAMLAMALSGGLALSLREPLFRDPASTVLLARDGRLLGAKIAADGQWRFPSLDTCPSRFAAAAIAFEDRRFFSHPGVDPLAVARAAWQNAKAGKTLSGASTLTMQVLRLSRKNKPRTWLEKTREAFLALGLELITSKKNLLALYASHAPFGGNVVGLSAAAWRYFGRGPEDLSWSEATLLAVLPNSPALIHPGRNREALRQKRNRLLARLWKSGVLDSAGCALAQLEPLPDKPLALPRLAPHYLEKVATHPSTQGRVFASTLNADWQARVHEILDRASPNWEAQGIYNAAALILRTSDGQPLAYAGNLQGHSQVTSGTASREVDVIAAPRSTGSLLKPFLYAAMLDAGEILPGTLLPDIPSQMGGYAPENFDRGYEGVVPAAKGLARSLNVPAVHMLQDYGVDRFLHLLRKLGMTTANRPASDYGLTLILGGAEGKLGEMAALYAGLARRALGHAQVTGGEVFGTASAWLALQAMAEVSRPDAEKYWRSFASSRWVAWKTGTSFGFRDAWAMGVTPEFVVGIWVGNADGQGRPGMTGIQLAAPLLFEVFNLLPATTVFPKPLASLRRFAVCRQSGMLPSPHCQLTDTIHAPAAGLRSPVCPYHRLVHTDGTGAWRVHDGCEPVSRMRHQPWFVLPPSQEWHYRQRHSDYVPLPRWRPDCEEGARSLTQPKSMDLIYPRGKARIYVPMDIGDRKSRTVFKAVHRDPAATVFWYLDQAYLGQTREFHQWEADPTPGPHALLLVDGQGERLERDFEVLTREESK